MARFGVRGHEAAVRLLERGISEHRLHHAYLFTGPAHVGKTTLAIEFAQAVTCDDDDETCRQRVASGNFPDVRFIRVGEGDDAGPRTQIGIGAIRDTIAMANLRPFEGPSHVFIFEGADHMSHDAANALLKLLEEPPPDVLLILLTEDAGSVLDTVRSRCLTVEMRPLPVADVARVLRDERGVAPDQAEATARLSRGCIGWALNAVEDQSALTEIHQRIERVVDVAEGGIETRFAYADDFGRRSGRERAAGREELYAWLRWLRDVILVQQGRGDDITNLGWRSTIERHAAALTEAQSVRWAQRVGETIEAVDRNANARLAVEALLLDAPAVPGPPVTTGA